MMKIGLVVGRSGYYSKVSGNKWVTTKTNNTTSIKKLNLQTNLVAKGTDYLPWTTLNASLMTSVG